MTLDTIIKSKDLAIVSGEGEVGTVEPYTGARTARALRARLTRERCRGDRWARVICTTGRVDDAGNPEWVEVEL